MIHTITFASCPEKAVLSLAYANRELPKGYPKDFNPWKELQALMAQTHDTVIWIVTTDQLFGFMEKTRQYKLQQYFVVDHRDLMDKAKGAIPQGTTNRNYPDRPRRLKVFIMKGVGE